MSKNNENTENTNSNETEEKEVPTTKSSPCPDCVDINGVSTGLNLEDRTKLCATCEGSGTVEDKK